MTTAQLARNTLHQLRHPRFDVGHRVYRLRKRKPLHPRCAESMNEMPSQSKTAIRQSVNPLPAQEDRELVLRKLEKRHCDRLEVGNLGVIESD